MGVIATAAKFLIAAGVTGEELVKALEEIEDAGVAALTPSTIASTTASTDRLPASTRQARWRERKRLQERLQTSTEPSTEPSTKASTTGGTIGGEVISLEEKKEERSLSRPPASTPSTASRFPEFRAAYPKRAGSTPWTKAGKIFDRLVAKGSATPEQLIAGAQAYAQQQQALDKVGTEYVAMPTTWLNQERWRDASDGYSAKASGLQLSDQERYERAREAFRYGSKL
jgi:hypothetical protein